MSEHPTGPATRERVQRLVDKLIQRRRVKLTRDEYDARADAWRPAKHVERHMVPSLWEQLCASTQWQAGGKVSGGSFGSRPVIATGIVSVRAEIELFAVKGADEVSNPSPAEKLANLDAAAESALERAELRRAELAIVLEHPPGTDAEKAEWAAEAEDATAQADDALQELAAAVDRRDAAKHRLVPDSLRAVAANITDQVDLNWWRDNLQGWISEIKANLALTPSYPQGIRGGCPSCGADSAPVLQDGEMVRGPALAITWAVPAGMERPEADEDEDDADPPDLWVRAIECRACGQTWFRGSGIHDLVAQMERREAAADQGRIGA